MSRDYVYVNSKCLAILKHNFFLDPFWEQNQPKHNLTFLGDVGGGKGGRSEKMAWKRGENLDNRLTGGRVEKREEEGKYTQLHLLHRS